MVAVGIKRSLLKTKDEEKMEEINERKGLVSVWYDPPKVGLVGDRGLSR